MMDNVVILTPGLSGSSVLASLLVRAGYWQGDETAQKREYDTFENRGLVEINRWILQQYDIDERYYNEFNGNWLERIRGREVSLDESSLESFVKSSNQHHPWLWKDPRLWLTIDYWARHLDLGTTRFILLSRDSRQLWISCIHRRQIQSLDYCRHYNGSICQVIREQAGNLGIDLLEVEFEKLLCQPDITLRRLNQYLGTELTVQDLRQVYRHELYRLPRGRIDYLKAVLIYLKNYRERRCWNPKGP